MADIIKNTHEIKKLAEEFSELLTDRRLQYIDKNHLDYLEPNAEYAELTLDNKFQIFVKRSEYTVDELNYLMNTIETKWEEAGCLLNGIN